MMINITIWNVYLNRRCDKLMNIKKKRLISISDCGGMCYVGDSRQWTVGKEHRAWGMEA